MERRDFDLTEVEVDLTDRNVNLTDREVDCANGEVDCANGDVDLTHREVDLTVGEVWNSPRIIKIADLVVDLRLDPINVLRFHSDMSLLDLGLLTSLDDATLRGLHERLNAAGLTPAIVADAAGIVSGLLPSTRNAAIRRVLASRATPGADFLRLFAYDDVLANDRCIELLGASVCDALRATGVLIGDDQGLRARILVSPMADGVQILSDHLSDGAELAMGPGAGTAFLAGLIPPDAGPFLDLGCGAGSLAIVAALRGARPVVGTDVNPRAIEYARVNARLNGVDVEWLRGDMTRPVRDRRFDCVVSQPPFVARPSEGSERSARR